MPFEMPKSGFHLLQLEVGKLTSTDIRAYMSPLPELDFTGLEKLDFVVTRDREETAEVTTRYKPVMVSSILLNFAD